MAGKAFNLKWHADQVMARINKATAAGINETMGEAVHEAKANHPGWQNRTGTAEGSVKILGFANAKQGVIEGRWGSLGVEYVEQLEFWHGAFLRSAADATYGTLKTRINRRL